MEKQNEAKNGNILFSRCCNEWLEYKKNLDEMEQYDMNEFIKIKKEQGITSSLKEMLVRVKSILRYTKKKYGINFDFDFKSGYVANMIDLEVFNEKEKQKLYKFLTSSEDIRNLGILICIYSGLRIGEVCGLKWKDIDFESKEIFVQRTVQRLYKGKNNNSEVIVTLPKTKRSARKIPIAKVLIDKLKEVHKNYSDDCFITTGVANQCYEPLTYRHVYKQILKHCQLPYKKFHCLRHTFATRCIRVGMDIKSLSEVLGHSNIGTTMNIYVHSSYEVKKKYIDRL